MAGRDFEVVVLSLAFTIWCFGFQGLLRYEGRLVILIEAVKTTAMTSFLLRYDFGNVDKLGDEPEFFIFGFVDLQELVTVKFFVFVTSICCYSPIRIYQLLLLTSAKLHHVLAAKLSIPASEKGSN